MFLLVMRIIPPVRACRVYDGKAGEAISFLKPALNVRYNVVVEPLGIRKTRPCSIAIGNCVALACEIGVCFADILIGEPSRLVSGFLE